MDGAAAAVPSAFGEINDCEPVRHFLPRRPGHGLQPRHRQRHCPGPGRRRRHRGAQRLRRGAARRHPGGTGGGVTGRGGSTPAPSTSPTTQAAADGVAWVEAKWARWTSWSTTPASSTGCRCSTSTWRTGNACSRTNLTSAFLVGREAARHMIARGRGQDHQHRSVQTDLARPTIAPYTAAKGGLRNLTRAMTAEWAAPGLQINAIAPGLHPHRDDPEPRRRRGVQRLDPGPDPRAPLGHRARTWSDRPSGWPPTASNFVNGQTIFIDGGMTVVV